MVVTWVVVFGRFLLGQSDMVSPVLDLQTPQYTVDVQRDEQTVDSNERKTYLRPCLRRALVFKSGLMWCDTRLTPCNSDSF